MSLSERAYELLDLVAHKLPPQLMRIIAIPLSYHMKATDGFLHHSAGMAFTAFGYISNNKIKGDYVEFGVYRGRGIIDAFYSAKKFGLDEVRFWAFDSFEGLPAIEGKDVGGPFVNGEFKYPRDLFERNLRKYGVDIKKIEIVQGFYNESLSSENYRNADPEKIAIAWIDCDLYESTVPVLQFLTNRLVDGAVVIFDDWYCFNGGPDKGEQKACAEWRAANSHIRLVEYQNFHWGGKSFIFNRL
ncbi:MAG: TylF/MycF/NovP-related O-methyltransferase [Pyrinomonadaceae bacterium]